MGQFKRHQRAPDDKLRERQLPYFRLMRDKYLSLNWTPERIRAKLKALFAWGGDENYWEDKIEHLRFS